MAAHRTGLATWYETFPVAAYLCPGIKRNSEAVLLVDIGGNTGSELGNFHKAYPSIPGRLVSQDLPSVIRKVLERDPHQDVELMEYDFFTPQPVQGTLKFPHSRTKH
jgi:hypothetical protein